MRLTLSLFYLLYSLATAGDCTVVGFRFEGRVLLHVRTDHAIGVNRFLIYDNETPNTNAE
jgi:hypothetical protein